MKNRIGANTIQILGIIAVIVLLAGLGYMYLQQSFEDPEKNEPLSNETITNIPDFSLLLIGANGTEMNATSTDFEALTQLVMEGGLLTSAGSIKSIANYTGVSISEVCELVGGFSSENSLRVTASDDYAMIFTWDELNGDFITFNPATGDEVENNGNLVPALSYLMDDEALQEGNGPLRMVILGDESLITEGHYWIKEVVKVEVVNAVQEYTLNLTGYRSEIMDRPTFESGVNCPDTTPEHKGVYVDDDERIWTGIPLWLLVGRVEDSLHHTTASYNREMADNGAYTIYVIAEDGYSVELNSSFVKLNQNILIANEMDGAALHEKYWPLRLVGSDLDKGQMIRNIATIELKYNEGWNETVIDWGADWNLTLTGIINETLTRDQYITGTTCDDALHSSSWIDGDSHTWSGLPLWYLVGRVDDDVDHGPGAYNRTLADEGYFIRVVASDGYYQEFNSSYAKLNDNLIIANSYDNGPLPTEPKDYSPLRLVGPELTSGQMVRNITEIQIIFSE